MTELGTSNPSPILGLALILALTLAPSPSLSLSLSPAPAPAPALALALALFLTLTLTLTRCAVLSTVITTSTNQFSTIASTGIGIHQRSVLGQAGCKFVSKRYDWLWPFPDSTDCNPPRLAGRKRFECLSWGPGWG